MRHPDTAGVKSVINNRIPIAFVALVEGNSTALAPAEGDIRASGFKVPRTGQSGVARLQVFIDQRFMALVSYSEIES
jgi:hypothetical protein